MDKKKKKVDSRIIKRCIIAAVLVGIVVAAVFIIKYANSQKIVQYQVQSINFTEMSEEKGVKLIAHRGFRAIAPENTVPAFARAGEAGYWGAECDIFRTADGVWVLMHDETVNRMTNGKGKVEKLTYEEIQNLDIDKGNNLDSYHNVKVPTLDEYLFECETTEMNAFIELKSKNNTEYYQEIVDTVNKYKVEVTYISFYENDLREMRKLSDAPMFLLSEKITDKAISAAKDIGNCGIEFNVNKKKNLKKDGALIKKVVDEGLLVGAWAVDTVEMAETLYGYGVYYMTTDCITY